jgi:hypothetical protein
VAITEADVRWARQLIENNTMTLPGFTPGSRVKVGPGAFSASDALVLYLLKFHKDYKICPPLEVVSSMLSKLNDTELNRKSVGVFWMNYSTTSDVDDHLEKASFLKDRFTWYLDVKKTVKLKRSNARLRGLVGAEEAWSKAMLAQKKYWRKSTQRETEFILKRDAYRAVLDAENAVGQAEKAVAGY